MKKRTCEYPNRFDKLTQKIAQNAPFPSQGSYVIRDTGMQNFGLRVSPGAKSWIVQRKFAGRPVRLVLGSYTNTNIRDAKAAAERMLALMREGIDPRLEKRRNEAAEVKARNERSVTVGTAWNAYKRERWPEAPESMETWRSERLRPAASVSDESKKDWLLVERKLANTPIWNKAVVELSSDDLKAVRANLTKTQHRSASNGGQTTAAKVLRLIRAAVTESINTTFKGTIPNPFDHVGSNFWPKARRRERIVDSGQLPYWWRAVSALRSSNKASARTVGDFLVIDLLTGARKSELLKLKWKFVDFENDSITFPAPDTKARRTHTFPMTPYVKRILLRRRAENEAIESKLPWVFPSTRIRRGEQELTHLIDPKKQLKEVVSASAVPFSIHDLRRSFATNLNSGLLRANEFQIRMALNHASADVTLGYLQQKLETLRPVYERHEDMILQCTEANDRYAYEAVAGLRSTARQVGA